MRKITLFLALMVAMVTTAFAATPAEEVTVTKTKVALTTVEGQPGYVSCPQEHNALNPGNLDGDGVYGMLDGDPTTYMHTAWKNTPAGPHYFEVDMGENNSIGKFCFDYVSRSGGTDDYAREFTIKGSNDKSDFELITVVDFGSEAKKGSSHTSEVLGSDEKTYRYLRFEVTNTNMQPGYSCRTYFHAAEFALYTVKEEAAVEPEEPEATEGIDTSKEYYLYSSWNYSMNSGYLTIGTKSGADYGVVCMSNNKKAFKLTASGEGYILSTLNNSMPGMEYTEYIDCSDAKKVGNNAMSGSVLYFEKQDNGKYYIRSGNGYFNIAMISYGTDGSGYHVFSNGAMTDAAEWELVAVAAEPEAPAAEPLTYVSHTPNTPVERITEISIVFSKDVQAVNGMIKLKNGGNVTTAFSSTDVNINGSTVTYYLMSPVKISGVYTLEFPAEAIVATDGGKNAEAITLTINVEAAAAAPTFKSSSFGPKVNYTNCYSLEEIKVEFSENIEIASTEALELKNGEVVVATITDMEVLEGKNLYLYLDEPLSNEVTTTYSIVIPAGYVKTVGTDLVLATDVTISNIKVVAPFVIKNITPANGETVEAIENIVIECNNAIFDYNYNNYIKLKNTADGSEIAIAKEDYTIDGNVLTITPSAAIPNGTYTLAGLNNITNTSYTAVYNAPEYTITVAAPELDALVPTSYAKNAANDYELKGVKINFDRAVKKAADVTEYGKIVNAEGNTVAVLDALMGANGSAYYATPYTDTAITIPGTYKVVVYGDVIYSADGEAVFKGAEYEFEVAELPAPKVVSIDAPTGTVTSMDWYLEYGITISNTRKVVLADDKTVTYTVGEEVFEAELSVYGSGINYSIGIYFDWQVTYPYGDYTLTIPAGLYTVNGVANAEEVYTFTYAEPTPTPGEGEGGEGGEVEPVTVTVTPASGSVVEQIDAIQVLFSDAAMYGNIGYLYMYDQNENMYLLAPAPDYGTGVFVPVNMLDDQPIVITEPGTYTISLASLAEFGLTGDMVFSWTIGETTAIDAVDAEAENAVIYDLTGRRVEKITKAGIYVINGVKKVVK